MGGEVFLRSHLEIYYTLDQTRRTGLYYVEVAAEADFLVGEFVQLFGAPNQGKCVLCENPPKEVFWQFRRAQDNNYIVVVAYPGEEKPTIFTTSIHTYYEFTDYMSEGLDFIRNRDDSGC